MYDYPYNILRCWYKCALEHSDLHYIGQMYKFYIKKNLIYIIGAKTNYETLYKSSYFNLFITLFS